MKDIISKVDWRIKDCEELTMSRASEGLVADSVRAVKANLLNIIKAESEQISEKFD
jgi:hypothetical protein